MLNLDANPVVTVNSFVIPPLVFPLITAPSLISLVNLIYFRGTHFFSQTHHITSLGTLSYAFYSYPSRGIDIK